MIPKSCLTLGLLSIFAVSTARAELCSSLNGVEKEQGLLFWASSTNSPQTAMLNQLRRRTSLIEVEWGSEGIRFRNRAPGLGIPLTIFHVQSYWVNLEGETVERSQRDIPDGEDCEGLSLFPGQQSMHFKVAPRPEGENLRLWIQVWASEN